MVIDNKEALNEYDNTILNYIDNSSVSTDIWSCQEDGRWNACIITKSGSVGTYLKNNNYKKTLPLFVIPL